MKISEVKNALTLEQLEQMDGQRVLVPETKIGYGAFGVVDVFNSRVVVIEKRRSAVNYYDFFNYGETWIAVADPFGVLSVPDPCGILETEE